MTAPRDSNSLRRRWRALWNPPRDVSLSLVGYQMCQVRRVEAGRWRAWVQRVVITVCCGGYVGCVLGLVGPPLLWRFGCSGDRLGSARAELAGLGARLGDLLGAPGRGPTVAEVVGGAEVLGEAELGRPLADLL